MRQCVEVEVRGLMLRGTFHAPRKEDRGGSEPEGQARLGLLLLNSGFVPRASQGDVTVRQSDRIAELGFPAFRFDMPGLGDSEGDLPDNALDMVNIIQRGGHAAFAAELACDLKERYSLRGILLGGHCGGAITAAYAADRMSCRGVAGVLAFEPDFRLRVLGQEKRPRIGLVYDALRLSILKSPIAGQAHKAVIGLKSSARTCKQFMMRIRRLIPYTESGGPQGNGAQAAASLPADANLGLIGSWQRVVGSGLPVLLVTASGVARQKGPFDYIGFLLASKPKNVLHIEIQDTNHAFVEGDGPLGVLAATERWLQANFPASPFAPLPPVK